MSVLDRFFLHGTVDAITDVTPRVRRIRIAGESLRDRTWAPGQHIRLRVGFWPRKQSSSNRSGLPASAAWTDSGPEQDKLVSLAGSRGR